MDETRFTKYLKKEIKRPKSHDSNLVALDLFAGCGGLALGFEAQQFNTIGIESNHDASQTYNRNLRGTCYSDTLEIGYKYPIARPTVIIEALLASLLVLEDFKRDLKTQEMDFRYLLMQLGAYAQN